MIIRDKTSKKEIRDKILYENWTYQIDFENELESVISREINNSKLYCFIEWQEGNRFAKLCISNYIGNVYFFENTYDVRSCKFLPDFSGEQQFKRIINEIEELSKDIIYSFQSPSFVIRYVNFNETDPSTLLIYNYFKKIIIDWPNTTNLESSFSLVSKNSNFKYEICFATDQTNRIKKLGQRTIKSLVSDTKYLSRVNSDNERLYNLPLTRFLSQSTDVRYFPNKVKQLSKHLSHDTPENRFIKYFIRYIIGFVHKLNLLSDLPDHVKRDISQIKTICLRMLNSNFLNNVGEMSFLPANSSVLQFRPGYRDFFNHYIFSRYGIKHIFEDFKNESLSVDLKKISDLYEYWVFYKIAIAFLGKEIVIEQQEVFEDGESLKYGISFKKDNIAVQYNWSESRTKKSAYSRVLRPDTTVVIEKNQRKYKFIFDAKYKVSFSDATKKYSKSEDIVKMHAYRDAIEDVLFAISVYPGTEFVFYETDKYMPVRNSVEEVDSFNGVGALPFIPENENHQKALETFVAKIMLKFNS